MGKATSKDLYMQFLDVSVLLDGSDIRTLVSGKVDTGLSIRGELAFLIHKIEVLFATGQDTGGLQTVSLCTLGSLAAMPDLGGQGVLCKAERGLAWATSGITQITGPTALHYLPPLPLAAPEIHVYAQGDTDISALRGQKIEARLGFTTIPLDAAMYTEIAETWGW